jgi:hypothetical protein
MKALSRKLRKWIGPTPVRLPGAPPIRPHKLRRDRPELHLHRPRADDSRGLTSQICRHQTLDSPRFRRWITELGELWRPHRKLWELAFICQALEERGMLRPGRRGLGFAVGTEKLPALFAAYGCRITATDLPADDQRRTAWSDTGQYAGDAERLNAAGLCDPTAFRDLVSFRPVDMNDVPRDLVDYDFTWSTCSFEHCGSLQLGLDFLARQMDCLKPGGVAVHTTEFNLSSNDATLTDGPCVIYRLRDLEAICGRFIAAGHHVEPLDIHPGSHPLDRYVDEPPFEDSVNAHPAKARHLRLNLRGHASTSIALVIHKQSASPRESPAGRTGQE